MRFIGIIPARYASSRFPGKPLADMAGKPMIQRVYEQVCSTVDALFVATDDQRILDAVLNFGGRAVLTSKDHQSGTDRCYEALLKVRKDHISLSKAGDNCNEAFPKAGNNFDVVVNIQGDEPFIQPEQIGLLKNCFSNEDTQIATLAIPIDAGSDAGQTIFNPNMPKVVLNNQQEALYFSRSPIPFIRGKERAEWLKTHTFYKHIGLYAYRADVLKEITALPQSSLEIAESLEQLRWLQYGYKIKVTITHQETIGIDTPEDLEKARIQLKIEN